jgi:hypothetical protein
LSTENDRLGPWALVLPGDCGNSADENLAVTGEALAGNGFLRTGGEDSAGAVLLLKEAKGCMAMLDGDGLRRL